MMQTEKVILSAVEVEDVPAIVRWRNLPSVYGGFIEYEPLSSAAQTVFLNNLTPQSSRRLWLINARDLKAATYPKAVRPSADAVPVGTVGIMLIDRRNRRCEFGPIFIGEAEYRRRGLALDAELLVLDYCFNHLGMHKVIAHVPESNAAVIRLHEAAGFRQDVVLRDHIFRGGRFEDLHELSCLEGEFRERFTSRLAVTADGSPGDAGAGSAG
jgi:RimJ/RimL family protein N-acetyltransferase